MSSPELLNTMAIMTAVALGAIFLWFWLLDRRREGRLRERQMYLEIKAREIELEQKEMGSPAKALHVGPEAGGYIVLDLPEAQRPFFHDLLRGFEEYAQLKGYGISFSVDSSLGDRIGFKFTLRDSGVVVPTERVRQDFREYVDKVRSGAESLDDMPVVTSLAEHDLLVTVLKNRINFLQHSYTLSQNASRFYSGLLERAVSHPVIQAAPNVIVQTGGVHDSRAFRAGSSVNLIEGGKGNIIDAKHDESVRIANSFNQRQEQIQTIHSALDTVERDITTPTSVRAELSRYLRNVKDEMEGEDSPDASRIGRWLTRVKEMMQSGALAFEIVEAGRKVLAAFGLA